MRTTNDLLPTGSAMPGHQGKLCPALHDLSCFTFSLTLFAMPQRTWKNTNLSRHANMVSHCLLFFSASTIHQQCFILALALPLARESIKA
ncbi:hypothetical protein OIU84_009229 [Salix udensis]|uniref:Uncharacterized protein n=1 Tax=Salix udensis TaxID=889485 RepID=A0AAD6JR06_9ROSI|nr:hypothetical protein OIU84_009229 [Salix udensis]